jgi:hypothetical protein
VKEALTPNEYRFLREVYFTRNLDSPVQISRVRDELGGKFGYGVILDLIGSLSREQVLDRSPDHLLFKITDFGLDLYRAMIHQDLEWRKPGIIRVATFTRDEMLIPAGHYFTGQRWVKEILAGAAKSVDIIDLYIGSELFDRIDDADINVDIRVITQKCASSPSYYNAFAQAYSGKIELRNLKPGVLHARIIIVDGTSGYTIDHSLKDLGKKDAHIKKIADVVSELRLFEKRWAEGTTVS